MDILSKIAPNFALILLCCIIVLSFIIFIDVLFLKKKRHAPAQKTNIPNLEITTPSDEEIKTARPWFVNIAWEFLPVLLFVFILRSFLFEPFRIPSGSMIPTLHVGDFLLVNKFEYGIRLPIIDKKIIDINDPQRGDVMVFHYPLDKKTEFIKRIVGIPGDTVAYYDKKLTVNGKEITPKPLSDYFNNADVASYEHSKKYFQHYEEVLGNHRHRFITDSVSPNYDLGGVQPFPLQQNCTYDENGFTCKVPKGHYFMMGDNRDNSLDSRYWGFVSEDFIVGKAVFVWMNFRGLFDWHPERIGGIE